MIAYINNHLPEFWIALGFALLAAEVLLFGFSTIIFLFAGIGALVSGLLMSASIIDETWIAGMACFGIATGISSIVLWKPLMMMQNRPVQEQKPSSDIIGLEFVLTDDVSTTNTGTHRYSGVDWRVEIDISSTVDTITKGSRVTVAGVEVGVFSVTKKDS